MLIEFSFSNFKSFLGRASLNMEAHRADKTLPGAVVRNQLGHGGELELLPAAAIYGANAAGKTNIVLALDYLRDAVLYSQTIWSPGTGTTATPHATNLDDPSEFEIEFVVSKTRYRYGFKAFPEFISEEWLYAYPKKKERMLFERVTNKDTREVDIFTRNGFVWDEREITSAQKKTRENSLFLSTCAQDNQSQALEIYKWFQRDLTVVTTSRWFDFDDMAFTSRMCGEFRNFKQRALALLKSADSNLLDINISTHELPDGDTKGLSKFRAENRKYDVEFQMAGPDNSRFSLPMGAQSRGMQKLYSIVAYIVFALQLGEVVVIDELEGSMHPLVASRILALFQSSATNESGAQLIFTTHDTSFLSLKHLRRDQIWFVEKSESLSQLYSLAEFSPRKDENLEAGYLRGRFGAIPAAGYIPDWVKAAQGDQGNLEGVAEEEARPKKRKEPARPNPSEPAE